jgi:uncharacterized protein (DUF2267 family)
MDEIVKQITERTGISADQAREAAQTVVNYLKTKLPEPIASQVDAALSGSMIGDVASQALGGLGGMFGKKD